jgi:hypothetical protein
MTNVNGYPIYQHRDTGHTIVVHGIELDNRWVVPHNVYLSTKYDAHINVEVCNNIRVVKYLFKYIYKGHDRATVERLVKEFALRYVCDSSNSDSKIALLISSTSIFLGARMLRCKCLNIILLYFPFLFHV